MNSLIKRSLSTLPLLVGSNAFASDTTVEVVTKLYEGFTKPISDFSALLGGHGLTLIASLAVIHVVMGAIALGSGAKDLFQVFMDGLKLSFIASMLTALLVPMAWLESMTGFSGSGVSIIEQGFRALLQSAGLFGDAGGAISAICGGVFDAIFKMLEVPIVSKDYAWYEVITNLPAIIISAFWMLITMLVMLLTGALVLGEALGADILLKFVVGFAPLLVPWAMFKPLAFLFGGWLRALIIGCVTLVVAGLFVSAMKSFADASASAMISQNADGLGGSYLLVFTIFAPILIASLIVLMLAGKINSIASSLINGGGLDGFGFHAMRQAVGGMNTAGSAPGKAATQISKSTAKTSSQVRNTASNAAAATKGALNASRTGQNISEGAKAGVKARSDAISAKADAKAGRIQEMASKINNKPEKSNPFRSV